MKTIQSKDVNSAGIQNLFGKNMELEILGSYGKGDSKITLYRARTGQEVIETNSDPIFESEEGFEQLRRVIMAKNI